jgi:hypothetical protein
LPDGFFSKQKSKFGQILEGLRWRNVDIVFGHLEYFTDIGDFYDHFVFIWYIFSGFGIMYLEKSGNPACECA